MIMQLINQNNKAFAESTLVEILNRMHTEGPIHAEDFEKLSYIKLFHSDIFSVYETKLLFLMGLFYKVDKPNDFFETVYSIFADTIEEIAGARFTPVQADAYRHIREKDFFSFSAPTSAGKSFLFRELIIDAVGDIVIVVPSRALLAEYLSTVKSLVGKEVLVLQFVEDVNIARIKRRVFIITPERGNELFPHKDDFNIELFLFDEAQLSEEPIRGIGFDAFVRRVSSEFAKATKVFAHPFVNNPEAQLNKHCYNGDNSAASSYEQNAVGKIFLGVDDKDLYYFSPYSGGWKKRVLVQDDIIRTILEQNGTILIYTSKAKLYSKAYLKEYIGYLRYCPTLQDVNAIKYIEELREYIGAGKTGSKKESLIIRLMERGIVVHHGSMPLKMRLIIEQFVRSNHAKICFATSTLKQGINMPFDAVFLDNYTRMDTLTLKNLIGRSGRTTIESGFDFGYTIITKNHVLSFCRRINEAFMLKNESALDADEKIIAEDDLDLVEAIRSNSFDIETRLTNLQLERIKNENSSERISTILDGLLVEDNIITGNAYYENLSETQRSAIKNAFKEIYILHLRRKQLTPAEMGILSTSIPILLWHIQGKSFKEVLTLRYNFLTQQGVQRKIRSLVRKGEMSLETAQKEIGNLILRYSQIPTSLPNRNAPRISLFKKDEKIDMLDYDSLVFDTYDYIDKVISLSISDPICAAFSIYEKETQDSRAITMINYIRFGTNDPLEIWLLRYGFAFEEIAWIRDYVASISEQEIIFKPEINNLPGEKIAIIERYI
jgi:hypothetical protein